MTHTTRLPGAARTLTLIVALLTALALIPPAPAAASVIKFVALDDTQPEFGAGARTLTSVVPSTLSNDPIAGQITEPYAGAKSGDQGALALAAVRALRWANEPASPLPAPRTEVGAAVIGNNIWVIGGTGTGFSYVATVYRGTVNTNYGQPGAGVISWTESTPLPAVQHSGIPTASAPRTNAAVAARRTSGNAGNLYVIGGAVRPTGETFSSDSVLVGDIDANGNLTWRSPSYRLPSGVRLEGARAFVHTTAAGKTFLYVVGGRNDPPGITGPSMSTFVYYAEINPDGSLALGADNRTWNQTGFPPGMSVSDAAVTAGRYTSADGTLTQDMFFVYGGRTSALIENQDTSTVRKGVINPTTGAITWEDSSAGGGNAVLPANRNAHGAVEFNGSVYIIGGRIGSTIDKAGYASYIDPTNLRIFRDGPINFYNDQFGALPPSAGNGRSYPGVVLVPTSNPNYAFAYLIGGAEGTAIRQEVFRATIGPGADQTFYPTTGYYYSKPFSMLDLINEQEATVRKMTWLTNIDSSNGGDIKLEYRVYSPSSGNCNDTPAGGWTEVRDPAAGSGRFSKFNPPGAAYANNSQEYGEGQRLPPGNCFQYRATFTRGTGQNVSPMLLRLGMELIVPGNPDLNWPDNAVTVTQNADGTTRGVEVRLRNQNLIEPPTQPANVCHASQPGCNPEGTFFVDVFIFPPGVTPIVPTLPLLTSDGNSLSNPALAPYHRACLQIPKWVMQKDVTFT
ncbi:MAG: kelch repeat-containing protein [Roseiflexaceae bacterium]|nr:kelch repeat-containing protein [Roseiflexaceae bacterium]